MEELQPANTRGPVVRTLETLLTATVVLWVLDAARAIGLALYTEQFLALVLGLAMALGILIFPARPGIRRGPVPWYDWLLAGISLAAFTYVAVRYPSLSSDISLAPRNWVPLGVLLVLLVLEATRRATGMSLVYYTIFGLIYALLGQYIPGDFASRDIPFVRLATYLPFDTNAMLGGALQVAIVVVIPFILMGQILSRCGGSEFFTDLAMALMGRYRGGSAKVAVTASALFGMISGSAVANVSAVGVVTIPLMKRSGFSPVFAASVEAVGSTGGQLMPPVMGAAAFLMAEYLQVSYAAVLVAAIIPAFMYYFSLFMQVDLEAAAKGIAGTPMDRIPALKEVLREGWHFTLPFVALVTGLLGYNMEAEYAALVGVGVLIACCLLFSYRGTRMSPREIVMAIVSTGSAVVDIVLICAAAGILIGILNITGIAFSLTLQLVGLSGDSLLVLLLISAVVGILLGLGLPTTGVYVLMATLVAPALIKLGVTPMAAHMFVLYFGMMSMVTPPIALAAYAAANIAGCDPDKAGWMATRVGWASYLVPFLFVYDPPLLMQGSAGLILWVLLTNCLGIWCGTIAVVGHYMQPVRGAMRALFMSVALALLFPSALAGATWINLAGLALAAALLLRGYLNRERA